MSPATIHPALENLRKILGAQQPFVAGTFQAGPNDLKLFYSDQSKTNEARVIDFAKATTEDLEDLTKTCQPATFGRNNEDVLDESYRKAGKIDAGSFAAGFNLAGRNLLELITADLLDEKTGNAQLLIAELYKLNVYEKGAFFKAHKDTPRASNMIGSLVVVLPTEHEGGSLILRHKDQETIFDSGKRLRESGSDRSLISYVAFYSDVEHEVAPVLSGYRVTLTYNLYSVPRYNGAAATNNHQNDSSKTLKGTLEEILSDGSFLPSGGRLAFAFSHQYPFDRQGAQPLSKVTNLLKGSDARLFQVCKELGLKTSFSVVYDIPNEGWSSSDSESDEDEHAYNTGDDPVLLLDHIVDLASEEQIEDLREALKGEGAKFAKVTWGTKANSLNRVESQYIAYGNEAINEYIYGDVCLLVKIDNFEGR